MWPLSIFIRSCIYILLCYANFYINVFCCASRRVGTCVVCSIIRLIVPGLLCLQVAALVLYPACVYKER
jgi:hypothetical protein